MKKRILSLILVVALSVSLLPIQAIAITLHTDNKDTQTYKGGIHDGYHYELWCQSFGVSSMTLGSGGTVVSGSAKVTPYSAKAGRLTRQNHIHKSAL